MTRITLSAVLSRNARTRPIFDGRVVAEGVDLVPSAVHPSEMFWRQLHFGDFDISEMSLASLYVMVDQLGKDAIDWVALPIFTSRRFFHTGILIRSESGIVEPGDLRGRRVGVPEYQQTAAVWTRGVLAEHFSVDPSEITWFMERGEGLDHASGTGFVPPEGVVINRIPRTESIATFLQDGTIEASLMYLNDENLVDRSRGEPTDGPVVRSLFDAVDESRRYYDKSGLYPINHAVVLRRSIVEAYPWVVLNVYAMFLRANEIAFRDVQGLTEEYDLPGKQVAADLVNPYRYGVSANQPELETLAGYVHSQGLTSRVLAADEIFDARTLSL